MNFKRIFLENFAASSHSWSVETPVNYQELFFYSLRQKLTNEEINPKTKERKSRRKRERGGVCELLETENKHVEIKGERRWTNEESVSSEKYK